MTFIDADDGSRVTGAHVLFSASACKQSLFGCGESVVLFLTEAVTDAQGTIDLPAQQFSPSPFLFTGYRPPSMLVFKPGYTLTVLSSGPTIPKRVDMEQWTYNNRVIEMRRAITAKEFADTLEWSVTLAEEKFEVREGKSCAWQHIPRFLAATERAIATWKMQLGSSPDAELQQQSRSLIGPVEKLIAKDELYVRHGCASPRVVFQSYLVTNPGTRR